MSGPARTATARPDGLIAAPLFPEGPWRALRALHSGMREIRRAGWEPRMCFLDGIAPDGSLGGLRDSAMLVLGYRLTG